MFNKVKKSVQFPATIENTDGETGKLKITKVTVNVALDDIYLVQNHGEGAFYVEVAKKMGGWIVTEEVWNKLSKLKNPTKI